jgi:hypothetical protein
MFKKIVKGGLYYLENDVGGGKHPHIVVGDFDSNTSSGFKKIQTLGLTSCINSHGVFQHPGGFPIPVLTSTTTMGFIIPSIIRSWDVTDFSSDTFAGIYEDDDYFTKNQFIIFILAIYNANMAYSLLSKTDWLNQYGKIIVEYHEYCKYISDYIKRNNVNIKHTDIIWEYEPTDIVKECINFINKSNTLIISTASSPLTISSDEPISNNELMSDMVFEIDENDKFEVDGNGNINKISDDGEVSNVDKVDYINLNNEGYYEDNESPLFNCSEIITKYKLDRSTKIQKTKPKLPTGLLTLTNSERYLRIPYHSHIVQGTDHNISTLINAIDIHGILSNDECAKIFNMVRDDSYPAFKLDWISNDIKELCDLVKSDHVKDIIKYDKDKLLKIFTIIVTYQDSYILNLVDVEKHPGLVNLVFLRKSISNIINVTVDDIYKMSSFDFNKTYHQFGIQWLAVCLVLLKLNIDYRNDRPFLKNLYNISCINDYNTISNKDEKQISDIILNAIITAVNISAGNRYAELSGTRIKTIGNYVDKF